MTVDLTVRLGDILTMIGLFGGGFFVIFMMRADIRILSTRIASIETAVNDKFSSVESKLSSITDILVEQARHDQRLTAVERQLRVPKN